MRTLVHVCLFVTTLLWMNACSPWKEAEVILSRINAPTFPDKDFLITEYGAAGDSVTDCIVKEITTGTASKGKAKNGIIDSQAEVGGWPVLKSEQAPKDADGDGMPDAWEIKNKLNPNDAADANLKTLAQPYTNLEHYLNERCKTVIP